MPTERVTEAADDRTSGRNAERGHDDKVIVVERGGSGVGGVIAGVAILALAAIIAFFLLQMSRNDVVEIQAAPNAADGGAQGADGIAESIAGAAGRTTETVAPN